MSELAVVNQDIEVCAETPDEMKSANQALIAWCDQKINQMRVEHIELEAARDIAIEKGWKATILARHVARTKKRIEFYGKMKKALEHGYYIVPTFPVTVFAIRTDRMSPLKLTTFSDRSWGQDNKEQKPTPLPEGKGSYENPFPEIWRRDLTTSLPVEDQAKGKHRYEFNAEKWAEFDFPINMAKPRIMEATDRAMALKLFDDFGILPGVRRNVDPLIVGRIKDPRSTTRWSPRHVSFIIAWALDTKTL